MWTYNSKLRCCCEIPNVILFSWMENIIGLLNFLQWIIMLRTVLIFYIPKSQHSLFMNAAFCNNKQLWLNIHTYKEWLHTFNTKKPNRFLIFLISLNFLCIILCVCCWLFCEISYLKTQVFKLHIAKNT